MCNNLPLISTIYNILSAVYRLYQLRGQEPINYFNTSSSHLENTTYRQHSITQLVFISILVARVCIGVAGLHHCLPEIHVHSQPVHVTCNLCMCIYLVFGTHTHDTHTHTHTHTYTHTHTHTTFMQFSEFKKLKVQADYQSPTDVPLVNILILYVFRILNYITTIDSIISVR